MSLCPFSQFHAAPRDISGGDSPAHLTCGLAYAVFIPVAVEAASSEFSRNVDL